MKKPDLKLIKSEEYEEKPKELHERSFTYDLTLSGEVVVEGEDVKLLEDLCQVGMSLIETPEFSQTLREMIYALIAERLEASDPPPVS